MLSEGTAAPLFELPALIDGERRAVSLSDYLGEDVVILAFYPADFNPACDETSCGLDELDLFTMQKDVTILGISPDSVYSHQAFADRYDLHIPLLSDTDHEVAREYRVGFVDDIGQRLIERAVVVIDHDGEVQYAWSTDALQQRPHAGEITDAIADTGGDDTAFARYRVGHAHYTEGRRAFTAAMSGFRDSEWMVAQGDFQQAREEFDAAEDHFDTAVRFVDDESLKPIYADAQTKTNSLWQASDWLAQAARAYSSGDGAEGQALRDDAERLLETARGYEEPPAPDGSWPPDAATLETDAGEERPDFRTQTETIVNTSLDTDIDEAVGQADGESTPPSPAAGKTENAADGASQPDSETESSEIDDTDIEEVQAELTASEQAGDSADSPNEAPTTMVEAPPDTADTTDDHSPSDAQSPDATGSSETETDEPAELDLTDPAAADADAGDRPPDTGSTGDVEPDTDKPETDAASDRDTSDEPEPDT